MEPILDPDIKAIQEPRTRRTSLRDDLPDFYERPPRRIPAMIQAGFAFAVASAAFYGAQAFLPVPYRPSDWMGGFEVEMAEAQARGRAEGELAVKIVYDKKLKLLETTALAIQEACKAEFQRGNQLYQATWERANTGYKLAGEMQNQYMRTRYGLAQQSVAGEISITNLATTLGYVGGLFDQQFGEEALAAAENVRQAALKKIDEASRNGQGVDFSGWSQGLPDPATLQPLPRCEIPQTLVSE